MISLMPKKKSAEPHQLAAIMLAKVTGEPLPAHLKQFEHLVKKRAQKPAKKARK